MPLSWNEIKSRAITFTNEWKDEGSEDAEAKAFLIEFFDVFGITRRKVASFEHKVKKLNKQDGFIDLFWKGVILIEMKSRGKNLDKAYQQAKEYLHNLPQHELPKYILVSDFENFILYDQDEDKTVQFKLQDFVNNVQHFGFISGYEKKVYKEQDPANIKAAELMGKLHDSLKEIGYEGHPLEVYLVRLLFCLFAEDTNIFEKQQFQDYIEQRTNKDGSDLASKLHELFQVLNTPSDKRFKNIDEQLKTFPYVNGKLFEEPLPTAGFDATMRQSLLDCCYRDWSKISPAIFGSMFQSIMNDKVRRNLGAHYTSEKNILKLIRPLFLDELEAEFNSVKNSKQKLKKFHDKISNLRFLDPACGCGNFLIIAYRELRLLEIKVIEVLLKDTLAKQQTITNIDIYCQIDVDRFYGIEYEEFPAQIAQVAMWLIDHQMNQLVSLAFGNYYVRLPLRKSATIVHGNALSIDWQSLLIKETTTSIYADEANLITLAEPEAVYKTVNVYAKKFNPANAEDVKPITNIKYDFILGNPPFIGKKEQNAAQKVDMDIIFHGVNGAGVLDYVTAWYIKAAKYMQQYNFMDPTEDTSLNQPLRRTLVLDSNEQLTKTAFVSTNSIAQGEQVGLLWNELFNKYKIKIHFAHRTFSWRNEARGNAAVHVVIIGFANFNITQKVIFEYENIKGEPHGLSAKNINPFLVEGKDGFVQNRKTPICNVPPMNYGSMPIDDGHLILSDEEKELYITTKEIKKFIRPYTGGDEFINNKKRWCIWLKDVDTSEIRQHRFIIERLAATKKFRQGSNREATQKLSLTPGLFGEIRQPNSNYIIIPKVSSETRRYIPIGILSPKVIASGSCLIVPNATSYSFGIITSLMQMIWMKYTCGRMKSDYQYSASIVYNNFPWPENPNEKQVQAVEVAAQNVLDVRAQFPNSSLADLYDPNTMPPVLVKAHQALDKAVDFCYRPQAFVNETKRIEFLFELYDKYTSGMFGGEKAKVKSKKT